MNINLVVIKSSQPDKLAAQYELLGLEFHYHNHGTGPYHYASTIGDLTFEIYPLPKSKTESDNTTRLGFNIEGLHKIFENLKSSTWKIQSDPQITDWGLIAVIEDLDGRKIELKDKNISK